MRFPEQVTERQPVRYLDQATYRKQKAALTRAKRSGEPMKVVEAVEKALSEWRGLAWPDDWAMWNVALQDAISELFGWRAGMSVHVDDATPEWFERVRQAVKEES